MKKTQAAAFLAVSALALVAAQGAQAADLPRKAPIAAPIVAPMYNWTGFYVGVHAGYGWSDIDAATTFLPTPAAFGADNFTYGYDADGFLAGGQIGFNYQIANWLLGIEADISWADINGGATVAPMTFLGAPLAGSFHTSSFDMNWFGTLRGRLGFTANQLLVYVTGGLAFADIDYAARTFFAPGAFDYVGSGSSTEAGWTLGGGVEWAFAPNWSAKFEYLYYDLGDTTIIQNPVAPNPPFQVATNFDNAGHIVRIGLNYRFGWGGPVVARY